MNFVVLDHLRSMQILFYGYDLTKKIAMLWSDDIPHYYSVIETIKLSHAIF